MFGKPINTIVCGFLQLFSEHVAQYESLKQAPLIMSGTLVSDASEFTVNLNFSDLPELFKDNSDFESVGDMLDLLETYEKNNRAGNTPNENRELVNNNIFI